MLAVETRRSPWGSSIPTSIVRDFIQTALRHDALADFVQEYVFDALDTDGQPPAELGDALRVALADVIEASTHDDWRHVGEALVADARECVEGPPAPGALAPTQPAPAPTATPSPRRRRSRRRQYRHDGPHARSRRETANRLIEAYEHLRREQPNARLTLPLLTARAEVAKETIFQQFGRTAGLRWAADARTALRLPMLWAQVGLSEPGTPLDQARAAGREYLRLALAHPGPIRTLVVPHELDELLRPKDPRSYRTLQEFTSALTRRVGEQDRLLEQTITNATFSNSCDAIDAAEVAKALTAAWLRVATLAWQLGGQVDDNELFAELDARTDAIRSELAPQTTFLA